MCNCEHHWNTEATCTCTCDHTQDNAGGLLKVHWLCRFTSHKYGDDDRCIRCTFAD